MAPLATVKYFDALTVRKWEEHLAYQRTGELTPEQRAEQTRVKVL